jgi:hypothetical protein
MDEQSYKLEICTNQITKYNKIAVSVRPIMWPSTPDRKHCPCLLTHKKDDLHGTYKGRNEIETNRKEINENETKRNEPKSTKFHFLSTTKHVFK